MIEIGVRSRGRTCPVRIASGGLENMISRGLAEAAVRGAVALLSDVNVYALYGAAAEAGIKSSGSTPVPLVVEPGETSKSVAWLERICGEMLDAGVDR